MDPRCLHNPTRDVMGDNHGSGSQGFRTFVDSVAFTLSWNSPGVCVRDIFAYLISETVCVIPM